MKKIVFFILLSFILVPTQLKANTEYTCNNNTFEIVKEGSTVTIVKRGVNPFIKEYGLEGHSVTPTKLYCTIDTYYFYGYSRENGGETYYDTYLLVIDHIGNVIHQEVTDFYLEEELSYISVLDNTLITVTNVDEERIINGQRELFFKYTLIQSYDSEYHLINSVQYSEKLINMDTSNQLLLLSFTDFSEFDVGLDKQLKEYTSNDILTLEQEYNKEVHIPFINEGRIDGVKYYHGVHLDYPGNYTFKYNEQSYSFTVHPEIIGVENGNSYEDEVTIYISNGNITLDGESYISGSKIDTSGKHTLVILGVNGYKKVVEFTITSNVNGVINGHGYTAPLNITFNGEAYLNNNLVTSPLVVEEEGDYLLRVRGSNGYVETYEFTYHEEQSPITVKEVVSNLDIFILVIVVIGSVIIIKRK